MIEDEWIVVAEETAFMCGVEVNFRLMECRLFQYSPAISRRICDRICFIKRINGYFYESHDGGTWKAISYDDEVMDKLEEVYQEWLFDKEVERIIGD